MKGKIKIESLKRFLAVKVDEATLQSDEYRKKGEHKAADIAHGRTDAYVYLFDLFLRIDDAENPDSDLNHRVQTISAQIRRLQNEKAKGI